MPTGEVLSGRVCAGRLALETSYHEISVMAIKVRIKNWLNRLCMLKYTAFKVAFVTSLRAEQLKHYCLSLAFTSIVLMYMLELSTTSLGRSGCRLRNWPRLRASITPTLTQGKVSYQPLHKVKYHINPYTR